MLTQPVGTSACNSGGFYDLLGNVAEWLAADSSKEKKTAFVAGGTAQDSPQILVSVPLSDRLKAERNRFIGFRIACEAGK
jgi:formylglycine-generating enzyme required for sulfatase activity